MVEIAIQKIKIIPLIVQKIFPSLHEIGKIIVGYILFCELRFVEDESDEFLYDNCLMQFRLY